MSFLDRIFARPHGDADSAGKQPRETTGTAGTAGDDTVVEIGAHRSFRVALDTRAPVSPRAHCPLCQGDGTVMRPCRSDICHIPFHARICPECQGSGYLRRRKRDVIARAVEQLIESTAISPRRIR